MAMPLIAYEADPETKTRFAALAVSQGTTQSDLLRQIVATVLATNTGWQAELKSGHRGGVTGKIDVRMQQSEVEAVRALAAPERRSAAAWILALVRAKLADAVPFNPEELKALKDAAVQLASVGRNLNALVRGFNRTGQVNPASVNVAELAAAVDVVKWEALAMRDRAMKRYTTE